MECPSLFPFIFGGQWKPLRPLHYYKHCCTRGQGMGENLGIDVGMTWTLKLRIERKACI